MSELREIIFEFVPSGAYVKVSAVDPASTTEVSIVGDPAAGEATLKRIAEQKLRYVMERKGLLTGNRGP